MILTGNSVRQLAIISPYCPRTIANGMTYGESGHGYDIRLGASVIVKAGRTTLGYSLEHFTMPNDVAGRVCDKSTWIRRGVRVGTTIIEAGWRGHLTLELVYHPLVDSGVSRMVIKAGSPIAQVIFERLDAPAPPYRGKYQDQPAAVVPAIMASEE